MHIAGLLKKWFLRAIRLFGCSTNLTVASRTKDVLANVLSTKILKITRWLTESDMKVNEAKADLCLFHKNNNTPIQITIKGTIIQFQV